jgi:hypothetical protein
MKLHIIFFTAPRFRGPTPLSGCGAYFKRWERASTPLSFGTNNAHQ